MKGIQSFLGAILLSIVLVSPTLAAKPIPAFVVGPNDGNFGETAGVVDFSFGSKVKADPMNFWARVDCYANETTIGQPVPSIVYAEFLHLGPQEGYPVNDNTMTFGPTPSWSGGGADCTIKLLVYDDNGNFDEVRGATDTFIVLP